MHTASKKGREKHTDADFEINNLQFYIEQYLDSAKYTLGHVVAPLGQHIQGAALNIGKAISHIERVRRDVQRHIQALKAAHKLRRTGRAR